jgi:bacillithiol system protein YtxJ
MGLFSSKKRDALPWKDLTSVEQLAEVIQQSAEKPVLFFKHSTRCVVSSMALKNFEDEWSTEIELCDLYFLDLLNHRATSTEIAVVTGVEHQSPQVIVVQEKTAIYDASHAVIDALKIQSLLKKA